MQKYYALINQSGAITQVGSVEQDVDLNVIFNSNPAYSVLAVETADLKDLATTRYNYQTQEFITVPAQPTPYHEWTATGWQDQTPVNKKWEEIRRIRDAILQQTDWIVVRAAEASLTITPAFTEYRQDLRDVTEQPDAFNITWPQRPAGPIFVE
jgi:hypothetical protein